MNEELNIRGWDWSGPALTQREREKELLEKDDKYDRELMREHDISN